MLERKNSAYPVAVKYISTSPSAQALIDATAKNMAELLATKQQDININEYIQIFTRWLKDFLSLNSTSKKLMEKNLELEFSQIGIDSKDFEEFKSIFEICCTQFAKEFDIFQIFNEFAMTENDFCDHMLDLALVLEGNRDTILGNINQYLAEKFSIANRVKKTFFNSFKSIETIFSEASEETKKSDDSEKIFLAKLEKNNWQLSASDFDHIINICKAIADKFIYFRFNLNLYVDAFNFADIDKYIFNLKEYVKEKGFIQLVTNMRIFITFQKMYISNGMPSSKLCADVKKIASVIQNSDTILANNFIMPIQRIPRWELLLIQLNKLVSPQTAMSNKKDDPLVSLEDKFSRLTNHVNSKIDELNENSFTMQQDDAEVLFKTTIHQAKTKSTENKSYTPSINYVQKLRECQTELRKNREKENEKEKEEVTNSSNYLQQLRECQTELSKNSKGEKEKEKDEATKPVQTWVNAKKKLLSTPTYPNYSKNNSEGFYGSRGRHIEQQPAVTNATPAALHIIPKDKPILSRPNTPTSIFNQPTLPSDLHEELSNKINKGLINKK